MNSVILVNNSDGDDITNAIEQLLYSEDWNDSQSNSSERSELEVLIATTIASIFDNQSSETAVTHDNGDNS